MKIYKELPTPKNTVWNKNILFYKLPWRLRYFLTGIKNIFKWIPTIYHDRDWDGDFIYKILQKKIEFQRKELVKNNRHTDINRDNRDMTLALNLLERIREEYYQLECLDYWEDTINFENFLEKPNSKSVKIKTTDERFDDYLNKYPSSVRAVIKKNGVIENKKTLCLEVSYYNHSKANKLLFRILEEKIPYWWD